MDGNPSMGWFSAPSSYSIRTRQVVGHWTDYKVLPGVMDSLCAHYFGFHVSARIYLNKKAKADLP
ncbi:hypothetical protein L914_19129 [Phytophthora nicotianae]|uniref:Uncharacterized protein n=1 Tax=Phytophthora nicotianae TaxID=4792 RepID=W2MDS8_PHYNI|nr:hypothetical protein L914_19129 [Phytophthora nicotianae]